MAVMETDYLHLSKPLMTDYVDVSVWNANMDIIDTFSAGVYPKTDVDLMLSVKANLEPTEIQSGEDLNAYTTLGSYISPSGSVTESLLNAPSSVGNNGFSLEILKYANYPGIVQRVMWNEFTALIPHMCIRGGVVKNGVYEFGAWHTVTMTAEA